LIEDNEGTWILEYSIKKKKIKERIVNFEFMVTLKLFGGISGLTL